MKRDIGKLNDAICEAYVRGLPGGQWAPFMGISGEWYNFCNEAVNYICKAMDYQFFDRIETVSPHDAILANQMFDIMIDPESDWMQVSARESQALANGGALVIAGWKHPTSGHGHVAVVRPGCTKYSGNWKSDAPKILNIGKDNFIHKKASWAFRMVPHFFVLKDMA